MGTFFVVMLISLGAIVHSYFVLSPVSSETPQGQLSPFYAHFLPAFRLAILGDFDTAELRGDKPGKSSA